MRALILLASLCCIAALIKNVADAFGVHQKIWEPKRPRSTQAYVTLLYGDEFLLGVRVLGKSIRDTGTSKDLAVLVSDGVSMDAIRLLEADGWIVERIELLSNPNQQRPARFWGVYTKLKIFNMTQYQKVVYLDADTIVVKDIEDLFQCQKFCANLKHSERLNSGVMVVEPSAELFDDMLKKVSTLPSYTGGDQGFLNSYYPDFPNAQLFDPNLKPDQRTPRQMERLSTLYNADVGLYVLANKWMVDGSQLRVVHYTLGPLKPWDWWTEWLLKPVDLWQDIRRSLKSSLPGTGGGLVPHDRFVVGVLSVLPVFLVALLIWYRRRPPNGVRTPLCNASLCGWMRQFRLYRTVLGVLSAAGNGANYQNGHTKHIALISIVVCFVLALLSAGAAFHLIPRQVMPWTGMLLLYEWTIFLFSLSFGTFLGLLYDWGKSTSSSSSPPYKGHSKQASIWDMETTSYGFGMAALTLLVPCLPFLLGITAMFARVGTFVGAGMVLAVFMTYSAQNLGVRWFLLGREDGGSSLDLMNH
ncbi:inositol phosphorylceramide glucuronosyltransferase 1 [Selaginella moellendorffii]|uniref:inositol phosphorylceramide glucuronosyltransferase 1 n=1 Tax=Selaginella moellendorffii TaxID=88036 RepID=UPI000D1CCFDF|nr:inositol phosphorylceramide glucuronosyltransferase 1 [Selaginella moellendorffii]|eukprot:XP_024540904.1 inositol phosphorylceramide glucuronosyltransferase 1 [Selaginella moellendorffii]